MCPFSLCHNVVFDGMFPRYGGWREALILIIGKNELITTLAHRCLPPCSPRAVSMCLSVCVHLWFHCCSDGRVGQLTYGCALWFHDPLNITFCLSFHVFFKSHQAFSSSVQNYIYNLHLLIVTTQMSVFIEFGLIFRRLCYSFRTQKSQNYASVVICLV